jgi:peptidyl-prolyl cis-trans isomerase D
MLQSIRDRTQGWIAGVIISLVILSFALWGIHSYLVGAVNTEVIAKVNGVEVTKRQLSATYDRMRRQAQANAQSGSMADNADVTMRHHALDSLINIQVLKQASTDQDFKVSTRQIDYYLESMPEFQVNGAFSLQRFQQLIAGSLYTTGDFLDLISTSLLIDQPRLGIILSSFSLPDEVKNSIALVNQERDVDYMSLPRDYFLKQNIQVSDDEVNAYYKEHQDTFKTPAQVSIDYIELSRKDLINSFNPSDDVLRNFYNENVNTYTLPMQWDLQKILIPLADNATPDQITEAEKKAQDIKDKVAKGADLSSFSLQYPVLDGTSSGWTELTLLPNDLQKPVMGLTKAGDVSDPIRTSKGIMLVKAVAIKQPQPQSFDQVKDKVKDSLARQQAEEKFADIKEKLANTTYEHPDSLAPAAKELNLPIKSSDLFTQQKGGADEITSSQKVRDAAFSPDVLTSQNNSDVIQVSPDVSIVMRVKSNNPASVMPLEAVHKLIADTILDKKSEEKAVALADEIKKKLQSGTSPEQIAQQYGFTWDNAGYIGRYSTKVDSAILFSAFRLPRMANDKTVYDTVKIPTCFAIVAMKGVRDGKSDLSKDQYEAFAEQVQNNYGALEYKLYQQSLTQKAKIVSYIDTPNPDNQ